MLSNRSKSSLPLASQPQSSLSSLSHHLQSARLRWGQLTGLGMQTYAMSIRATRRAASPRLHTRHDLRLGPTPDKCSAPCGLPRVVVPCDSDRLWLYHVVVPCDSDRRWLYRVVVPSRETVVATIPPHTVGDSGYKLLEGCPQALARCGTLTWRGR
eukprot:365458-Chlamydomonas_euryale.AAC.14